MSAALQKAEDIYIDTSPYVEETDEEKILTFHSPLPAPSDPAELSFPTPVD